MIFTRFFPNEPIPNFDSDALARDGADEHWTVSHSDGTAACSLWWKTVAAIPGERLGVIGHFSASSLEAGIAVLDQAAARLGEENCTLAIGPMDGNTWRRYRVVTERGTEPAFFMEPDNPDIWTAIFNQAGFGSYATYCSSVVGDLSRRDPRTDRALERLERSEVRIRELDPRHFVEDLRRIYEVSRESFVHNTLYTEISESAFLSQYLPYREKMRPELILLAEQNGRPVGYVFGIPDFAQALRGEPITAVIGKTLAVLPGKVFGGLGLVLTESLHQRAHQLGYQRVIHALQYDGNRVRNMSQFFSQIMRRYTLFSRRLA